MKIIASLSVISISGFVLGPLLSLANLVPAFTGFIIFGLGMILAVIAWFSGGIYMAKNNASPIIYFLLPSAIPVLFLVYSLIQSRGYPPINDITTDTSIPPAFSNAQDLPGNSDRDMSYPNEFTPHIQEAYSDLQTLPLLRSPDEILGALTDFINEKENWAIESTVVSAEEILLEGTATSSVFGFVDDFIVRITQSNEGSVVDIRSKSRDGKGDFGANAQRIRDIYDTIR
jgi:uncharacterized protein (DUF1499 family)